MVREPAFEGFTERALMATTGPEERSEVTLRGIRGGL
jgi:hypothetical protein